MTNKGKQKKPQAVLHAEWALWIWTAWTCLYGIFQAWISLSEIEKMMSDQLQGLFIMEPRGLIEIAVIGYGVLAVISCWLILKIGAGQHWARSSLLWGFILEAVWMVFPPYRGIMEYLIYIPDLALQGYAIYMLYTEPARSWFQSASRQ